MKKSIINIFVAFPISLLAQNLVPNPSFETYDTCPTAISQIQHAIPWLSPDTCCGPGGSTDYLNSCASSGSGVKTPLSSFGFQYAKTGNGYAGINTYTPPMNTNYREYIEVKLLDSLIAGKRYCVSMYASLANCSEYSTNHLGIYFSNSVIKTNFDTNLPYTPQVISNSVITDTTNWTLITDTLIAFGGEKYITIGNFGDDNSTTVNNANGSCLAYAYYFIDDVSVLDCGWSGIKEEEENIYLKLFPNPSNGNIQASYSLKSGNIAELIIYDIAGSKINSYKLAEGENNTLRISESALKNGIYFYQVIINGGVSYSDKLIIIK